MPDLDILDRLRNYDWWFKKPDEAMENLRCGACPSEAADEIERLRATLTRMIYEGSVALSLCEPAPEGSVSEPPETGES